MMMIPFFQNQDNCTDSDFHCLHKEEKPLFLKELKELWEDKSFKGRYSASNTLLIDDEPHTALLNPVPNISRYIVLTTTLIQN